MAAIARSPNRNVINGKPVTTANVDSGVKRVIPKAPTPMGSKDPRYNRYLQEYQNAATSDARRAQIDAVWKFGKNTKTAYKPPVNAPMPNAQVPTPEAPAPTTPAHTTPAVETPTFKSVYDFMPKDYTATPMYQFQKEQGSKDLARLMASRGLTNSGAEIEANSKFLNQLGAQESERAMGVADRDASRYDTQAQNEATLGYNRGNDQWTRIMDLLNYSQRNSPYDSGVAANDKIAGLKVDQGQNMSNYLKDAYGRKIAGGGGGGGGAMAPFIPPAKGMDTSMSDLYRLQNGGNTGSGLLGTIFKGLSGLF